MSGLVSVGFDSTPALSGSDDEVITAAEKLQTDGGVGTDKAAETAVSEPSPENATRTTTKPPTSAESGTHGVLSAGPRVFQRSRPMYTTEMAVRRASNESQ